MRVLRRVRRFLPQGEIGRGVLTLVGGTTIAQLIVIASSPVLTRVFTPSEVGVYSVTRSLLSILIVVTCLCYEYAIPLPESDVAAANVLVLALGIAAGMSLAAGIALYLAGPSLLAALGASALGPYVVLLALGQLAGGVVAALTSWAVRTKTFADIAATRLAQSGAMVTAQLGLGLIGVGALGLLLGDIAGRFSGTARLARAAWRTHAPSFRSVSRAGIVTAATRYRRFAIFSTWSSLLNTLGLQAPLLFMVAFFGTEAGGRYALAERTAALPVTLIAGAVGQVFVAQAARLARDEPPAMRALFLRTTWSLARVALGPALLLAVLAPVLFGPLFGEEWRQAGLFVSILSPMYYLALVASPTGGTLDVLERQDLFLARELLRLCLVGGAVLIADSMHFDPIGAVATVSVAGCLTYSLYGLISWRAIVKHRPRPQPAIPSGRGADPR